MLGFTSEMYLLPRHKLGFYVVYNRNAEAGGGPTELRELLTDKLMNYLFPQPVKEEQAARAPLNIDTNRFAGSYANNLYCHTCYDGQGWGWGLQTLKSDGPGRLVVGARRWIAVEPLVFQEENGARRIAFRVNKAGEITHSVFGHFVSERLGDQLLTEVLGSGWQERPVEPLTARVYRDTGQWDKAAAAYSAIVERRPNDGRAHYYLGYSLLNGGSAQRALTEFQRAVELRQFPVFSTYYIAAAHAALGEKEQALTTLEQAVKMGFSDQEMLRSDRHLASLREDPRFKALLK
jgi:tetratricopeptide (TPR) repeat protein